MNAIKSLKSTDSFILGTTIIIGLLFKLWFISLALQPYIYDQYEYWSYAQDILRRGLSGNPSRTSGFPLFLALIYLLFNANDTSTIFLAQAVIDVVSGVLLFYISLQLFKSKKIAFSALFLQIFNPFTTAYVGVILTEVLSSFLIVVSFLLFSLIISKKNQPHFLYILLGISIGFLTQTRPVFLYWNIVSFFLIPYLLLKNQISLCFEFMIKFSKIFFLLSAGTLIAFSYQIISNMVYFRQFSLTTVDFAYARELYNGALLKTPPLFPDKIEDYPIEMRTMYEEYNVIPRNTAERKQMADKYFKKAAEFISHDPVDYIVTRVRKMWSMWQKPNVFFYQEPNFEKHWVYTYILNLVILAFFISGLIISFLSRNIIQRKAAYFVFFLLLYMTLSISLTHAEPRLTIPAYPVIFLFASVGIVYFYKKLRKLFVK